MAKDGNIFIKPRGMAQKVNEYENIRKKKIEVNNMRLNALGLKHMANSLLGSSKENDRISRKRNNRLDLGDDDEDYQLPDGEENFSFSNDDNEEIACRASSKRLKVVSSPTSIESTLAPPRNALPIASTLVPTPTQDLPLGPDSLPANPDCLPSQTVRASTSRRVRGASRGINTERLIAANGGTKLVVEVPLEVGAPVGENATRFVTWLGTQIRLAAPLKDMEKWDDIPPAMKAPIIQATRDKFEIVDYDEKEHVVRGINRKCQKLYRTWRHNMKEHYKELVEAGKDTYSNPYKGVKGEDWAWMIDNIWTNTDKEKLVEKKKDARDKLPWNHCMGSKSFASSLSIQAKERGGQRPSLADFFKSSHYNQKKKKWVAQLCEKVHEQLEVCRQEVDAFGMTEPMPQELTVVEADGKKWYPKEYGVGSKPSASKRSRASSSEEVLVLRNEVVTLKEACQTKENEVDTLKDLCKKQEEMLREYDEKFERSSKLLEEQTKKIEQLDAIVSAFMQGARTRLMST